jgi:hypothetical protein
MFSYTQWTLTLLKAAGHKYIKRIPYQSGGKLRYRYIYNVTHTHAGKHILDPDHMKVGTKLMLDATSGKEVHGHITAVSGDKVTFAYDDGPRKGESVTMSKAELATELDKVHGISDKLSTARTKQKAVVDKLKERGASEKQIAREQRRLDALGGEAEKADEGEEDEESPLLSISEQKVEVGGRQYSMWDVLTGKVKTRTPKGRERSGDYDRMIKLEISDVFRREARSLTPDQRDALDIRTTRDRGYDFGELDRMGDYISDLIRTGDLTKDSKVDENFLSRIADRRIAERKKRESEKGEQLRDLMVAEHKKRLSESTKRLKEADARLDPITRETEEVNKLYTEAYRSEFSAGFVREMMEMHGLSHLIPKSWTDANFAFDKLQPWLERKVSTAKKRVAKKPVDMASDYYEDVTIKNADGSETTLTDVLVLRPRKAGFGESSKPRKAFAIANPSGRGFKIVADDPESEFHQRVIAQTEDGVWEGLFSSDFPTEMPKNRDDKEAFDHLRSKLDEIQESATRYSADDPIVTARALVALPLALKDEGIRRAKAKVKKEHGIDVDSVHRKYKEAEKEGKAALAENTDALERYYRDADRLQFSHRLKLPSPTELIADTKD